MDDGFPEVTKTVTAATTASARAAKRLTSVEGWREVGRGVFLTAGHTALVFLPDPSYDREWPAHSDDRQEAYSRLSRAQRRSISTTRSVRGTAADERREWLSNGVLQQRVEQFEQDRQEDRPKEEPDAVVTAVDPADIPFHVYSRRVKWYLVIIIGVAGLFSGLSSNIYLPSLSAIAEDLHVSLADVGLTITSYLVVQGISPLFWGSLSDTIGRRPVYLLSFSVYIISNIVLSITPNFPVLLVFRGLQAAGSASTVSIGTVDSGAAIDDVVLILPTGNGVIQDIATPDERGAFISFYQAIRNFSIAVGPVIGGLLANFLGFRSVFVFLFIASSLVLLVIAAILPETLRSIAGNGSLKLTGIYRPLLGHAILGDTKLEEPEAARPRPKVGFKTFLEPVLLLREKDILVSLLFGGAVYAVWSIVVATTTGLFKDLFNLSDLLLGVTFLPNGLGTIVGSVVAGKLMTREFLAAETSYLARFPSARPPSKNKKDLPVDFPLEHARLRHTPWITLLFVLCTTAYGFTVLRLPVTSAPGWIAVPLLLQFVIAATSNAVFAINTTLVSDLSPGKGASSTAVNNLVRCGMAALGVAFGDVMIQDFGPAATFLGLGVLTAGMSVFLAAEFVYGMRWRRERRQRAK
ncbi:Major facilitator superfamily transporter [Cordyceps fumosorosea ARSEF 2679]|uniref:Major facilitator superfamily transporter n=1 Tax=Cordyceps fumosorosea (strain ARSEF 2679) TaxID=1081104 RepID=A0A162JV97_CORFA|nr:Major facilitator superfamily transporter [Cordyceps fumosorosea ARSEF 2679]OAA74242.1 Major facilitator superfamily transporter [Cordyceps fumosorosea ARSEF 2679]